MEGLLLTDFVFNYRSFKEVTNMDDDKTDCALIRAIKIKEKCIVICAQKLDSGTRTIIGVRQVLQTILFQ